MVTENTDNVEITETPETTEDTNGIQPIDSVDNSVSAISSNTESVTNLQKQIDILKAELKKQTNGVSKKLQSQIDAIKNPPQQLLTDKEKEELTIEALKSEISSYNQKILDIQNDYTKKIDQMKLVQDEKERKVFISGIKSTLIGSFAKEGFDDVSNVLSVFIALHPESNFHEGSDGVVIYKGNPKDKNDKGVTLESLVNTWKETAIAKRFIPGDKLAQGAGTKESDTPGNPQKTLGKSKVGEIVDRLKSGELEFRSGYY